MNILPPDPREALPGKSLHRDSAVEEVVVNVVVVVENGVALLLKVLPVPDPESFGQPLQELADGQVVLDEAGEEEGRTIEAEADCEHWGTLALEVVGHGGDVLVRLHEHRHCSQSLS